jgi:hypothetical protein
MQTQETPPIPPEIRAQVEATALFESLRRGDYAAAAAAQERLRTLGWHISREHPRAARRRREGDR